MSKGIRTLTDFNRQFKKLQKNHHQILSDLVNFTSDLEATCGTWDRVPGVDEAPIWATRMQDSSSDRGKSGGFRVHLYVTDTVIWLVHIQHRKDSNTVSGSKLLQALKRAKLWPLQ